MTSAPNPDRAFLDPDGVRCVEELLARPWSAAWPSIRDLWSRATSVYVDLAGPVGTTIAAPEYVLACEIAGRFPEAVPDLRRALLDPDPKVAAYSLVALTVDGPIDRSDVPAGAFLRQEMIAVWSGCFRSDPTLGRFFEDAFLQVQTIEEFQEQERVWAGRERACPKCGARFTSVQALGTCPSCRHTFRAGNG